MHAGLCCHSDGAEAAPQQSQSGQQLPTTSSATGRCQNGRLNKNSLDPIASFLLFVLFIGQQSDKKQTS